MKAPWRVSHLTFTVSCVALLYQIAKHFARAKALVPATAFLILARCQGIIDKTDVEDVFSGKRIPFL